MHACVCWRVHVFVYKNLRMSGKPCLFKACCSRATQVLRQLFCLFAHSNPRPPTSLSFIPSPSVFQGSKGLDIIHKARHHLCLCLNKISLPVKAATKYLTVKQLQQERKMKKRSFFFLFSIYLCFSATSHTVFFFFFVKNR